MNKKQVQTIADIARLANVSKSTVSRVLSNSSLIGEDTKERVRTIVQQNHFIINAYARQLSLKQSRTVGFVVHPFSNDFSISDLFLLEVMGGISNTLSANGYDMLVIQVDPQETEWAHQYLDSRRVDGFILLTSTWRQRHIQTLVEMGAPFIVWGVPQMIFHVPSVAGDNFQGGTLAAEYLLRSGRRHLAFLGGPAEEPEIQLRFSGYAAALTEAGRSIDPAFVIYEAYSSTAGTLGMQRLLEQASGLDAVFVTSDLMAMAAMQVIHEHGRRIPEDVAVVGYDDLSIAELTNPPLTTIRQNIPLAGRLLAQNLINYWRTGQVTKVSIPVELIIRQSA